MNKDIFLKMGLAERIDVVNKRFGGIHPDRITQPSELFNYIGKSIYLVLSPFCQEQNIGNAIIFQWFIDKIIDEKGKNITNINDILTTSEKNYFCISKKNDISAISIKDFNISPNLHNNHAAFITRDGAEAYAMFRKLQWNEDENLRMLSDEYDFWMPNKKVEEKIKENQNKENKIC